MSSVATSLHPTLRSVLRLDWTQVSYLIALRNTVGVVAPLAVGAAAGHLLVGLTVSLGALQVAFLDGTEPYRQRAVRMLAAGVCSAASVFIGSTTGEMAALAVLLAALWGFWGGLLVALGQAMTQIGLSSVVLLLVFAARPAAPQQAALQAGLVLAGAAMQTLLTVAPWPVRPFGPHRAALATALHQLAIIARTPADPASAPAATTELTSARLALEGLSGASSETAEALCALLDETERIRLEIVALQDMGGHVSHEARAHIAAAVGAAADVLEHVAGALQIGRDRAGGNPSRDGDPRAGPRHAAGRSPGPGHLRSVANLGAHAGSGRPGRRARCLSRLRRRCSSGLSGAGAARSGAPRRTPTGGTTGTDQRRGVGGTRARRAGGVRRPGSPRRRACNLAPYGPLAYGPGGGPVSRSRCRSPGAASVPCLRL